MSRMKTCKQQLSIELFKRDPGTEYTLPARSSMTWIDIQSLNEDQRLGTLPCDGGLAIP